MWWQAKSPRLAQYGHISRTAMDAPGLGASSPIHAVWAV
jgi:hypothetical protein